MDYSRGSQWRKWDLHVHSPWSILNNQFPKNDDGTPDWEQYLKALENVEEVGVVGVTDYFSIRGYRDLKQFKNQGRLKNIHNLLPNIELRLDTFVKDKRINYHVIFSDDLTPDFIEQQFLHNLDFVYENQPQETQYKMKLTESNLEELGRKLKAEESSLTGPDIVVGASNAVVQLSQVVQILNSDKRFKGRYLLVVAEQLWADIPWQGQDHQTRKTLLQQSDMVFTSNANTAQWCLGKPPYGQGDTAFLKEFKTFKPCIHGSDAHKLDEILKPCAKRTERGHVCDGSTCDMRYCWIKADPTFDGLKQLLYEPEDRVKIQPNNPTVLKSGLSLSSVAINSSKIDAQLSIDDTNIPLNADLIAVTGAKGSGKTAFVDLIANSYSDRKSSKDDNSFVKRIASQPGVTLRLSLGFLNGNSFTKDVLEEKFVDNADLTYIAQAELESHIFSKGGLNLQINQVVFTSKTIKDSQLEFEFNSLKHEKTFLGERLTKINNRIVDLEGSTGPASATELENEEKKARENLKDKKERLGILQKTLSPETIALATSKQEDVQKLKLEKSNYETTLTNLRDLGDKVEYELASVNAAIQAINMSLVSFGILQKIPEVAINSETYTPIFQTVTQQIHAKLSETIRKLKESQEVIDKLETTTKTHALLSQEIQDLEQKLLDVEARQAKLRTSKTELDELRGRRRTTFSEVLATSIKIREKYKEITKAFSDSKSKVLEDIEFSARVHFVHTKFLKLAEDLLDLRSVNVSLDPGSDVYDVVMAIQKLTTGSEADIERVIKAVEDMSVKLLPKLKRTPSVTKLGFYEFLYGNYLEVLAEAKYKSVALEKLSLGQKATVLIKVYLAEGENPIIIDSHDDHLDNAFIMDELVPALREAKKTRQVVVVSNNGNVVVNSDSDQIVIASKANSKIRYTAGSLENEKIRNEALKVLEGGKAAFKKRHDKYRLG